MGAKGIGLFAAAGLSGGLSVSAQSAKASPFNSISDVGPLLPADGNGVRLPAGFKSRIVARSGQAPVNQSSYIWHPAPDGGACFGTEDDGWVYVSNSELPDNRGGVGALRFDASGELIDAYGILENTTQNCAGGTTPWGTWLSCEEFELGRVYECDPLGRVTARVRPALGRFKHEAAAVDRQNNSVYLTEDHPDGGFYRFTSAQGLPDLSTGQLAIARVAELEGKAYVIWLPIDDPTASKTATRNQQAEYTPFKGGEGIVYHEGSIYFSTKGDNRVWHFDITSQQIDVLYDASSAADPILTGVDNLLMSPGGDILVAEDGGDMQLVAISPDQQLVPLLQIVGQDNSEICGPAFDPSYQRLYFSSQRGEHGNNDSGLTYEITALES